MIQNRLFTIIKVINIMQQILPIVLEHQDNQEDPL